MEEIAGLGSVPELGVQAIFLLWSQFTHGHPRHLSEFRCCPYAIYTIFTNFLYVLL